MGECVINVRLLPRSSKNEIVGFEGENLKVKVKSPPVDGLANRDLIKLMAKHLKIPKGRIEIISGHTTRLKALKFYGINKEDLFWLLKNETGQHILP